MTRKTEGVELLVKDALNTFSEPYGEDIILEVCQSIEANSDWMRSYNELCDELSQNVMNNWIGIYTKSLTGLRTVREVDTKDSGIIKSYTKLTR